MVVSTIVARVSLQRFTFKSEIASPLHLAIYVETHLKRELSPSSCKNALMSTLPIHQHRYLVKTLSI